MTKNAVFSLLDRTGLRHEDDFVVPINGMSVDLPYMVVRTKETVSGSDNGMVRTLRVEWAVSVFSVNRDDKMESMILETLCGVGNVEVIRYPDGQPYQTVYKFTTNQIM